MSMFPTHGEAHVTREWLARKAEAVADAIHEETDDRAGVPASLRAEERESDWRRFADEIRKR